VKTEPREFLVATRPQQEWRWLIAIALFLAGVGSGTFVMSALVMDYRLGSLVGLVLGVAGPGLFFFLDLGRKSQFWRVMLRPRTSWISRGVLFIILFAAFGLLYLAIPGTLFLWADSGFLLSYSPAIPFWNTPLVPLISVVYALMSGAGLLFAFNGAAPGIERLEVIEVGLIVVCAILIFTYLLTMSTSTVAAREATGSLVVGRLAGTFWGLVVLTGLLIPFALALSVMAAGMNPAMLAVAGLLELAGGLGFRYCLLRSGIRLAVA
jgi:formate-dependent nitrite reductase membrane component NrfD